MRLRGTEEWTDESVNDEIAFEVTFAKSASSVLDLMDSADGAAEMRTARHQHRSESLFALGRAAEIAFVTGNIQRGHSICVQLFEQFRPLTPMQFALYACVGSILGKSQVHFEPGGILLKPTTEQTPLKFEWWPGDDSAYFTAVMRFLFPAAAASGSVSEVLSELFDGSQETLRPQALAALRMSAEFRALVPTTQTETDGQLRAIVAMEESYAQRLSLMQQDRYHWHILQPKGSLLDWPLLCVWVAVLRGTPIELVTSDLPEYGDAALFNRWLAGELQSAGKRVRL
ncbi:MAG: hypothetical protein WCE79_19790 [Xanthobacteraceae bacterium]